MLERIVDATHAVCQIRASKAPKQGSKLLLADAFTVTMTGRAGADGDFFMLELAEAGDFSGTGRTVRQAAAAALHRTPGGRRRRNPLPDSRCPPTGRRRCANRRPALPTKRCWPA